MANGMTVVYVMGLLIFGCLNTLTTKIQFTMESVGLERKEKLFEKPAFGTFAMFMGMTFVLGVHYLIQFLKGYQKQVATDLSIPLTDHHEHEHQNPVSALKAFLYIGIPANLDLVASVLMFVGLLYVPASVWQMLRGSMIIFSSIESVLFLGRVMKSQHIIGVLTCVLGICCVGLASYVAPQEAPVVMEQYEQHSMRSQHDSAPHLRNEKSEEAPTDAASKVMFGMAIIILGQVVQASQVVAEEVLMKDVNLPPLQIVGFEGLWGVIMCIAVVFPLAYFIPGTDAGSLENIEDTGTMLSNSPNLIMLVVLYTFSCATYNISGMLVTNRLSAVHRTMLEASRTAVIWIVDLCVYYLISEDILFGEKWNSGSYIQLGGFLLLLCGQSIYGEVLKLPCCSYSTDVHPELLATPTSLRTSTALPPHRSIHTSDA
eukprot:GEMP01010249.1.p1 GENE.GEMP01010249.1~~GEMP01010249.1.p1  ORF type:complete len:430 (+),score=82.32 GEMP01010249.1:201-1490(+)